MSSRVQVETALVQDSHTVNLLSIGDPIEILVSKSSSVQTDKVRKEFEGDEAGTSDKDIEDGSVQDIETGSVQDIETVCEASEDESEAVGESESPKAVEDTTSCETPKAIDKVREPRAIEDVGDTKTSGNSATPGAVEASDEAVEDTPDDGQCSPRHHNQLNIRATSTRMLTGVTSELEVSVRGDIHVVQFSPNIEADEDFTVAVFCDDEHIPGSPFQLRFVQTLSLSSVHTEKRGAVIDAGRPVNFIVPLEEGEEVGVAVEGPFGECAHKLTRLPNCISVKFMPKGAGAYTISVVTVDGHDIENSPFLILADFSSEEARRCHVLEEDSHLFEKPVKFRKEGISFRLSTCGGSSLNALKVMCSGPGKVKVHLSNRTDEDGVEVCRMVPVMAGNYRVSILWKGHHISGSPYSVRFRQPKNQIISNGLHLDKVKYQLGGLHCFKLNCSKLSEGEVDIQCIPSSAARITISLVPNTKSLYKCELLPLQVGRHIIAVRYKGHQVEGSPFEVKFEDNSVAKACRLVGGMEQHKAGSPISMDFVTKGAGLGFLSATVTDTSDGNEIETSVKEVSDDLYRVEFNPGQSTEVTLNVTYNSHHIKGSPFKLVLADPNNFKVRGDGLAGGRVGEWNSFSLRAEDPPLGAVRVKVEHEDGVNAKVNIAPIIKEQPGHDYKISYLPTLPGDYKITVNWGQIPISGSPFKISCYSAVLQVQDSPEKLDLGSMLKFRVQLTSGELCSKEELQVAARPAGGGGTLKGVVEQDEGGYSCQITPEVAGKHFIRVLWNKLHVRGSPFVVKVLTPPMPENVMVYGAGIEDGVVGVDREFSMETGNAGRGVLAIKVKGPGKYLKFNTWQDKQRKRVVHASYHAVILGAYRVEVLWAGSHVPGSPFHFELLPRNYMAEEEPQSEQVTVVAEVHPENVVVEMEERTNNDSPTLISGGGGSKSSTLGSNHISISNLPRLSITSENGEEIRHISLLLEDQLESDTTASADWKKKRNAYKNSHEEVSESFDASPALSIKQTPSADDEDNPITINVGNLPRFSITSEDGREIKHLSLLLNDPNHSAGTKERRRRFQKSVSMDSNSSVTFSETGSLTEEGPERERDMALHMETNSRLSVCIDND